LRRPRSVVGPSKTPRAGQTTAGLDPENPNAFITGLLFTGDINGNLFITPLAIDSTTGLPVDPPTEEVALPEPMSLVLFATALAVLGVLFSFGAMPRKKIRA